jgi:hypothetical protein
MPFAPPVTVVELASELELAVDSAIDAREDREFRCLECELELGGCGSADSS